MLEPALDAPINATDGDKYNQKLIVKMNAMKNRLWAILTIFLALLLPTLYRSKYPETRYKIAIELKLIIQNHLKIAA
jgi:hypothetical protein